MTSVPEALRQVDAIAQAVARTNVMASILDSRWFEQVRQEVSAQTAGLLPSDPSGFTYSLYHPLRGVDWFETAQQAFLAGQFSALGAYEQLAVHFCGVDPVRTFIPLLEKRLVAFSSLPFKRERVRSKLDQLCVTRSAPDFKNHLFEVAVLGDLALKGVLIDIEDTATSVDGVIRMAGREILVEATNTVQEVLPSGVGLYAVSSELETDQVIKKIRKKVAEGRQLGLTNGQPTLLFLALTRLGASRPMAEIAVDTCFDSEAFSALSGVVLSDSWRFQGTSWHAGTKPDVALLTDEEDRLQQWYAQR